MTCNGLIVIHFIVNYLFVYGYVKKNSFFYLVYFCKSLRENKDFAKATLKAFRYSTFTWCACLSGKEEDFTVVWFLVEKGS